MKILLVDGHTKSLIKFKSLCIQHQCKTAYIDDPLIAIKSLHKHNFDVVICADDLQRTSAFNFLKALSVKFPAVVRIAYQQAEENNTLDTISHYIFSDNNTESSIIKKIKALETNKNAITKAEIVKAVADIKTLPSPPKVYIQLNSALKSQNTDSEKIAEIISQDPALAAKVLQFSNSSFMPNGKKVTNICEAITKIGVDTISCIVMTAELFAYQPNIANFCIQEQQQHSLATARFAASMVDVKLKHETLLAGLLHDIGKLILFEIDKDLTAQYLDDGKNNSSDIFLEKKIFATDHCQIGAYLLHVWSFSYDIINAILHHHSPEQLLADNFGAAQAVYLANALLREHELDSNFIEHFKLNDKLDILTEKSLQFK